MNFDQANLQRADQLGDISGIGVHAKIGCNRRKQFIGRQRRNCEINGFDRFWQPLHQDTTQHCLACPDFTGNFDDAFATGNRVNQRFKCFAAIGTGKKEFGVRRNFERCLAQSEMF